MATMNLEQLWTIDQTLSSFDALKFLFTIASLYIVSIIYRVHKKYDKKYPLFAPGNMWNHFVMATDRNYPMRLLVRGYMICTTGSFIIAISLFNRIPDILSSLLIIFKGCTKST